MGCRDRRSARRPPMDYDLFEPGDIQLQNGATLRDAKLAYKTYGELNADKSNAIVYPTWYSGQHYDNEWLIGEGMALDPSRYFIVIPNMFGNGLSSSPSNTPPPHAGPRFPHVTMYDNVRVQHRLITERFGIERLELVTGWSMGAGQTYQWALSYPETVRRILPFCGSAKTSIHNIVFLEGVKGALTADAGWNNGWYREQPGSGCGRWPASTPAGASASSSTGRRSTSVSRSATAPWRTSSSASGRGCSSSATRTTSLPCSGPGRTPTSARPRGSAASRRHSRRSARRRSSCRRSRISTSRLRTTSGRSPTWPTRTCGPFPARGGTSPEADSTRWTRSSSTTRSRNCSRGGLVKGRNRRPGARVKGAGSRGR
ncbi:alpha/beta fold hydrolase [Nonomuraea recticatena]|uniref:alpha/beta fold hydrolase n=1 Tax=Nonomuraea recticatena TaxID=46178 RepID=UPI00360E2EB5